jgi:tetratricopeptide (TPR) repeat protein
MPEGVLGGMLGGEDEAPEGESPEAVAGAEAFAAAVAAKLSGADPEVAKRTSEFLASQSHLLKIQAEHLVDEHALRVARLRGQLRDESVRGVGLRLRVGLQVFLVLVFTVIGIGAAVLIRDAVRSRSIVVDAFDVSPDLAGQALNGRIVASGFHDQLTRLQAATRTSAQKRDISGAWTNDIAIDVPETGISLSELDRLLRTHFGHDQHISGSLVQTGSGSFALTVRGAGVLPKTFSGPPGDLDELLMHAAEYVYGEAQPGLFMHYLANDTGRYDEAIAFAKSHLDSAGVDDKAMLYNYWANSIAGQSGYGNDPDVLMLHRAAVQTKPDYWTAIGNLAGDFVARGREEEAIQLMQQMIKDAGGRPGRASEAEYNVYDGYVYNIQAERAANLADIASTGGVSNVGQSEVTVAIAQLDVQLHEVDTARVRLKTAIYDPKVATNKAQLFLTQALLAEEVGDLGAAARAWDGYAEVNAMPLIAYANPSNICFAAPTFEKTGQSAKADAALAAPLKLVHISTYVDCYRYNADVLELRGDWPGAQAWYAKAVQLVPSSPAGYYSWGLALLKRGDLAQAAEKLQLAHQKGPTWADPLKAWGDVLAKQGNKIDALAKYDEALKYAPHWKQLIEAHEALAKTSKSS